MAFAHRCRCCGPGEPVPGPIGPCSQVAVSYRITTVSQGSNEVQLYEGLFWLAAPLPNSQVFPRTYVFKGRRRLRVTIDGLLITTSFNQDSASLTEYSSPVVVFPDRPSVTFSTRYLWRWAFFGIPPTFNALSATSGPGGASCAFSDGLGVTGETLMTAVRVNVPGGSLVIPPNNVYPTPPPAGCGGASLGSLRGPARGRLITT